MNTTLIKEFEILLKKIEHDMKDPSLSKDKLKNSYRHTAVSNVINILKNTKKKITDADQLKNVNGIGKHTILRINEILEKGFLSELNNFKKKNNVFDNECYNKLTNIYGIGKTKANEIITEFGCIDSHKLLKLHEQKKITLPKNIIIGLNYSNDIEKKIPHNTMKLIDIYLKQKIHSVNKHIIYTMCGSYRREKKESGDIDILLSLRNEHTDSEKNYLNICIESLKNDGFIIESLTDDNVKTKYMGLCKFNNIAHRIDIRFVKYKSYPTALLYFTGSKDFNRKMRMVAKSFGYTLNEYGLYDKNNKEIKIENEKDVFKKLNMEYVEPKNRQ